MEGYLLTFPYLLIIPERFNYSLVRGLGEWSSGRSKAHHPAIFEERSGLMQVVMKAEKPRKQAISGRFWAGCTYRGRIKDGHKIEAVRG